MPKIKLKIEADFQNVQIDVSGQACGRSVELSARYGRITPEIAQEQPRTKGKRLSGSKPEDVDS